MSQVVVRLVGGLGNQMFQYAAARSVAIRLGTSLALDLSWFGTDPDRQFALSPFAIDAQVRPLPPIMPDNFKIIYQFAGRFRRLLGLRQEGMPVFVEHSFQYDSALEQVKAPVFLEGYFQSSKYFHSIRDQIAQDFTLLKAPSPSAEKILKDISQSDAICLHIRRGDYVTNSAANSYHGVCSLDYYKAGLDVVVKGLDNPHCFVFSDDMSWVRDNFETEIPRTFVDIHSAAQAHEDLRLMAACKSFVIANSSFSWWGAWLGARDGKVVVAPRQWFHNSQNRTLDLLPKTWVQL